MKTPANFKKGPLDKTHYLKVAGIILILVLRNEKEPRESFPESPCESHVESSAEGYLLHVAEVWQALIKI